MIYKFPEITNPSRSAHIGQLNQQLYLTRSEYTFEPTVVFDTLRVYLILVKVCLMGVAIWV